MTSTKGRVMMNKKSGWIIGSVVAVVILGSGTAVVLGNHQSQQQSTKSHQTTQKSSSKQVTKKQSTQKKSATSAVTARATTSNTTTTDASTAASVSAAKAKAATANTSSVTTGENVDKASEYSAIKKTNSGVTITDEMVQEARSQLRQQGVQPGSLSDLDIAKAIEKANNEGIDYKTAIQELFPAFFE